MSSAVDEDTARAIHSGRETIGAMLSSAQTHLQKVFIVFVIGFIGSFYALRAVIWDFLKATAEAEMSQEVAEATDVITRTPFEVILLQAKIGMFVGVLLAIPAVLYFSRDALRERGIQSAVPISKWHVAGLVLTSMTLFTVGVTYAYGVFFPYAFDFLGAISHGAGVNPHWGITEFTEFIALLTLSFGLAAQLPLFMGVLAYTEIVSYEQFRDKWRHSIVVITVFGAMFSPPDPFTLIMWAMPLFGLYVFSLGLSKVVTNIRRRGAAELETGTTLVKRRLLQFVGVITGITVGMGVFINQDGLDTLDESVVPLLPAPIRPSGSLTLGPTLESLSASYGLLGDVAVGFVIAVSVGFLLLVGYVVKVLQSPVYPREGDIRTAEHHDDVNFEMLALEDIEEVPAQVFLTMSEEEALDYSRQAIEDDNREKAKAIINRFDRLQEQQQQRGDGPDPDAIDFESLSIDEIEDLPDSVFLSMTEDQALEHSRQAMHDDNREKAEAIIGRFDSLEDEREAQDESGDAAAGAAGGAAAAEGSGDGDDEGSLFSSTAAGMLDPFTEDETTEDDIGGYAYDIAFIVDSLTSKTIYVVGIFMAVLGGSFLALYQGGFGIILAQFVDRVPPEILAEVTDLSEEEIVNADSTEAFLEIIGDLGLVVALHPVEVLIFMVKVSTILAVIAVVPPILYWAWPAAKDRGLVRGDRRTFLVWGVGIFGGFGLGLFLGFYWIAPAVISYLISDAIRNGMEVTYRINSFSWLVIYTTIGVGFLFNIIVTMGLFHIGGIINYRTMLERWRPVVVGIFTVAAIASPKGILTMLLVAIPIALTYLLGLAILYVLTAGGRLFGGGGSAAPPEPEPDAEGAVAE